MRILPRLCGRIILYFRHIEKTRIGNIGFSILFRKREGIYKKGKSGAGRTSFVYADGYSQGGEELILLDAGTPSVDYNKIRPEGGWTFLRLLPVDYPVRRDAVLFEEGQKLIPTLFFGHVEPQDRFVCRVGHIPHKRQAPS